VHLGFHDRANRAARREEKIRNINFPVQRFIRDNNTILIDKVKISDRVINGV
jgi:hypothetical protein